MLPAIRSTVTTIVLYPLIVCLGQLSVINTTIASAPVKLATELQRALHQKGTPYLECIFAKMEKPYQVISIPWARAQLGTKHGEYDGFFMASKNDKRDHYAVRSQPFFSIEWLYVVRKDSGLTPDDPGFIHKIFSANKGSARLMWLLDKSENNEITSAVVSTTDSMKALNMLSLGRIDVNLENNENLKKAFDNTGLNPSDFRIFVAKSKPVGVYFGNAFLKREPGFLEIFNASIEACIESLPSLAGPSVNQVDH